MQRSELLYIVDAAWNELSIFRGYPVQKDAPVCIHISRLAQRNLPDATLVKMPVRAGDFEAVLTVI